MKRIILAMGVLGILGIGFSGSLVARGLTGRQIMERVLSRTTWKDMQASVELRLINAKGQVRVRKMKTFSRKRTANESDMLMRFISPPDVKNTAFLIIEHEKGDDERYLYLPALRRVKRIASSGKGGNFMSSDFTYYDIGRPKLNDWTYKLLDDEVVNGKECYKIECLPAAPQIARDTGYGKIIRWIRKDILVTVKSLYYDRAMRPWKELTVPEVKNIAGVWFQTHMIMKDLQTGHRSEMVFYDVKVNTGIPASMFTKRALQRRR